VSQTREAKPVPWRLDLILGLIIVLGPQAVFVAAWWWMYYAGRTNQFPLRLWWGLPLGVVALCVFVFTVQTIVEWRRIGWTSRSLRLLALGWFLMGVAGFFTGSSAMRIWRAPARLFAPEDVTFLHGLQEWVEERADIEAIRDWAKAHPRWEDEQVESGGPMDKSRRPACVNVLHPSSVWVGKDATASISWGGGFFHWGMIIYPEGKEMPEPDYNELVIAPGVVLWDEP